MHRGIEQYGRYFVSWLGPSPRVVVSNPQLARDVFWDKSGSIVKSNLHPFAKLMVSGVIRYEGEKWARQRKIVSRAFHIDKLKLMSPAFSTCCGELVSRWKERVPEDGSSKLDVWVEFQALTGDAIARTAFGSSCEEGRRITRLLTEQTVHFARTSHGAVIPGYRFIPTKRIRRMKEIDKEVKRLLGELIAKRYEDNRETGIAKTDDLLGLLLESSGNQSEEKEPAGGLKMSTEEVIEECRLFYFAGQETTAVLLTWTMIVLSVNQDWQFRAREEVTRVFGGAEPDFEGLGQLKIVTMILHEVLRLYPPAPFLSRTVQSPMTLGNFEIPAGVHLLLPVISMHRDPEMWGDDALEFKPERFAEGVSKASKNPAAYLPFGSGPRICVGLNFSMIEAKLCLASIMQYFAFERSFSYTHAPLQVVTHQPQHGAQVLLRKL